MDYGSSAYSTVTLGNGFGGLARNHSLARSSSLRNSTGSIGNAGGGGQFTFDSPAGAGRGSGGGGHGGYGGAGAGPGPGYRANGLDPYGRPSSGRGGGSMQQWGGGGFGVSGGGMGTGRVSNSGGGVPLYSGAGGMVAGTTQRRPSTSGGWEAAMSAAGKVPLTQRLAQVKAVYAAAKFNRSLDSVLRSGSSATRPEVRAAAATTARPGISGGGARPQTPTRREGQRPMGFTCYLCGQQYGSQSLMKHIPQCQKKWVMVESQKPRKEQRPLPPMPPELESGELPYTTEGIEEFNQRMYGYWDKVSLVACPICARTFRPDAFERHAKVCTPDNPGGPLGPNKHAPPPGARPGTSGGQQPTSSLGRGGAAAGGGGGGGGGGGYGAPSSPSGMPPRREGQRPMGFTCYLCGQQYGSQSLMKHIPQCQKKWVMVESQKPRKEQRPLPPMPPELESGELPTTAAGIEEFNQRMYGYWDKVSLVACPICARTFRPDAFERHAKVCTPDNPGGPLGPNKHAPPPGARPGAASPARPKSGYGGGGGGGGGGSGGGTPPRREGERPRAYVCYLCGQQFGSQSLKIHIPQCYEKWLKVEANKLPKERKQPPPPPPELDQPLPTDSAGIDEFNSKMFAYYNGVSLYPCPHCGRTMRPEALKSHMKACTAEKPMARPGAGAGGGGGGGVGGGGGGAARGGYGAAGEYDDGGGAELEACGNCGRKMRPDALVKHQRTCTPSKPMKPVRPAGGGGGGGGGAAASSGASGGYDDGGGDDGDAGPEPPRANYNLPPDAGGGGYYGDEGEEPRVQCGTCGRSFLPHAYEKHSRVCAKVFAGKRKVFNSAAKRVAGTEAAGYFNPRTAAPPSPARPSPPAGPAPSGAGGRPRAGGGRPGGGAGAGGGGGNQPAWKAKSNALRQAMAEMRKVSAALARGEDIRNIPHVPSAPDPSLVRCPCCGRRFNAQAAERHIPRCGDIQAKPKFLKAGTGGAGKGAPDSKPLPRW